jgi:glycosyltransferase involved in cell wall biosynthesis
MPKVSVVIPAYNSMKYLPETVDSVLGQTFIDFEILIINDGSTDNICEWFTQIKDPRVKLISQENKGLSGARNTGIANAQGEYIAFLDADDLWEPSKLEKQVFCLDNNPEVGLVHTWMLLIDEHSQSTGRVLKSNLEGYVWEKLLERNSIACPSVIVRRSCLDIVGGFDPNLRSVEDWDMWIRLSRHYRFAAIQEPLAYYRQLSSSMSKNWKVMEKAFQQVIEKAFQSVSSSIIYLKNHSYGYAYLCLAWKAIQNQNRDYRQASDFRHVAITYYPDLRYSKEYFRLSLAIAIIQLVGVMNYNRVLTLTYFLRRYFSFKET